MVDRLLLVEVDADGKDMRSELVVIKSARVRGRMRRMAARAESGKEASSEVQAGTTPRNPRPGIS